jgi:hypothetical protein
MNENGIVMIGIILLALGFTLTGAAMASDNSTEDLIGNIPEYNGSFGHDNALLDNIPEYNGSFGPGNALLDDIPEYNGSFGPDNVFYGLKLALENWDESFTLNATEKLDKKVAHSRLRIAEAKAELKKKNSEAAQNAFEHYKEKIKETEASISDISGNDSGILNAQKMIAKHQYVLEKLLESHPDNIGIQNAYNNSLELENKFENKTERHLERVQTKEGRHVLKEIKKEEKKDKEAETNFEESEELKIKATITGNGSQIEIKMKFKSNSTDNVTIAKDILNELRLSRDNISGLLEIGYGHEEQLKDILEANAEINMNVSKVDFTYDFALNMTNSTDVIDGIYNRLSSLAQADIQNVLEINVSQEDKVIKKEDKVIKQEEKGIKKEDVKQVRQVIKEENRDMKENRTENREFNHQ